MQMGVSLPRHCKQPEVLAQRAPLLWGKKEEHGICEDDIKMRRLEVLEDLSNDLSPCRVNTCLK